jgi:hypothetical protein
MFSKFTSLTLKLRIRIMQKLGKSTTITKKKDALTADVKVKFLLQSHLIERCDKLV